MWIRTATERDLEAVNALLVEIWHDTYDAFYGVEKVNAITAEWHAIPAIKARLKAPCSEFIVADTPDGIAGIAFATSDEARAVDLKQLYVRPGSQGQGTGGALLAEIAHRFPHAACIRLEVEPANRRAVDFYRSNGFVEVGSTNHCGAPGSGIAALVLEKPVR